MKLRLITILGLFSLLSGVKAIDVLPLDSVLKLVMSQSVYNSQKIDTYEADVYMRAFVDTKKKNFLYRYTNSIPNFVLHDLKNDQAVIESVSKIKFKSPNTYLQDVRYVTGTLTKKKDIALLPLKFLSMNIYEETVPGENFYLPLRTKSKRYYEYELGTVSDNNGHKLYTIVFKPKYRHSQLLNGYFVVEDGTWRIVDFHGKIDDLLVTHVFDLHMGSRVEDELLPVKFEIYQSYKYLGNHVINVFQADLTYNDVTYNQTIQTKKNYHLGAIYRVRLDSVPLNNDTVLWEKLRTFPLTDQEQTIVTEYNLREAEEILKRELAGPKKNNVALDIARNMVMDTRYRHKSTVFGFSGLLNPAMFGYSTVDGITYKQSLNMNFDLERQQSIKVNLYGAYLFKKRQLRYQLSGIWNYEPWKLGYLSLAIGRGNPTYSSLFLETLQDTIRRDIEQSYAQYRDDYLKLYNSIELTNGFQMGVGIDYHVRRPMRSNVTDMVPQLVTQYHFVPRVSLSWTPGQYYVTDGIQKVNVRSDFPTFKVEYAQSFKDILQSNSTYSRFEFDISQNIRFDLMRKLNYHVGVGFFFNQENEYFNDFSYFAKNYFPETWGDGIGGGFNILPNRMYNSSSMYAQAHMMYETPRLFITQIPFLSNGVARERIYVSQLYLPHKKSFTEIGYGVGNRFLNAAVFVAFDKLKYYNIGGKAVFLF